MDCDWSEPGRAPYTGTARAAIMAFVSIPKPVRLVLIERAQRAKFDDIVVIDRDSIVGHRAYAPELRSMHFGSKGRVCDTITRNWKADHIETAMVFCEGDYCVARPSVCNNYAIVTRLPDTVPERARIMAQPEPGAQDFDSLRPEVTVVTSDDVQLTALFTESLSVSGYGLPFPIFVSAPPVVILPTVAAVPEPESYTMILVGLLAVAWTCRARTIALAGNVPSVLVE